MSTFLRNPKTEPSNLKPRNFNQRNTFFIKSHDFIEQVIHYVVVVVESSDIVIKLIMIVLLL